MVVGGEVFTSGIMGVPKEWTRLLICQRGFLKNSTRHGNVFVQFFGGTRKFYRENVSWGHSLRPAKSPSDQLRP